MADRAIPDIPQQIAAAFDWWRDAGVDCDFSDEPRDWIAANAPADERPPQFRPISQDRRAAPAEPDPVISPSAIPHDLPTFIDWWMSEPLLDAGRVSARVPPRGNARADLMVIVGHPEADDTERLLSGPEGRLLDSMLKAMGVGIEGVYVASALPRHTPHADWAGAHAAGLGKALLRHIEIIGPRRIIVFGGNILPLLRNDLPKSPGDVLNVNHEIAETALLVARELSALLERASWKASFWRRWLEWTKAGA